MIEGLTKCPACGGPVRQGDRGRRRIYCSAACRKAAHRARSATWRALNEPEETGLPTLDDVVGPRHAAARDVPAPDESTTDDVAATITAALAVAAEFRRHSVAASPRIAAKCGVVAAVLDAALEREFQGVVV